MIYGIIVTFHVVACLALILIVLLQTGRGAEMGAAFGGASQTLFGGTGATTFLGKLTTAAAIMFMLTCLSLSYMVSGPPTKSIMEDVPVQKPESQALPEAKPVQPVPDQPQAGATRAQPQESAPAPQQAPPQAQEPAKEGAKADSANAPVESPKAPQ